MRKSSVGELYTNSQSIGPDPELQQCQLLSTISYNVILLPVNSGSQKGGFLSNAALTAFCTKKG